MLFGSLVSLPTKNYRKNYQNQPQQNCFVDLFLQKQHVKQVSSLFHQKRTKTTGKPKKKHEKQLKKNFKKHPSHLPLRPLQLLFRREVAPPDPEPQHFRRRWARPWLSGVGRTGGLGSWPSMDFCGFSIGF